MSPNRPAAGRPPPPDAHSGSTWFGGLDPSEVLMVSDSAGGDAATRDHLDAMLQVNACCELYHLRGFLFAAP